VAATVTFDPQRHEPLRQQPWDESRVRRAIQRFVDETAARYDPETYWPPHPLDQEDSTAPLTPLYYGACGVAWALDYLKDSGAASVPSLALDLESLRQRNREWLGKAAVREQASYMMGDTPIQLMAFGRDPAPAVARELERLLAGNIRHPARELMWGAPGTLLAALFLHERTGSEQWAQLFRSTAAALWDELEWSDQHACAFWRQDMYGRKSTYLDAVHGFVATALPVIRGRHLLGEAAWADWEACIVNTIERTADREQGLANWRAELNGQSARRLVQYCHGAPGFVICLAGLPGRQLDALLQEAGETVWAAGPLTKGSNLCHGTGGNGYTFLKLYERTGDALWLDRARAFAMHGIEQTWAHQERYGQLRYSLWTGDLGFAIYLWDCLRAQARFPTLDVYWA
jgi:hypothetical protein